MKRVNISRTKLVQIVILSIIISTGVFFHFFNLNWGAPFYFQPDERQNIAYPILESRSIFLYDQENFDIGTFPLIVIKLLYPIIGTSIYQLTDPVGQVIVTARFLTALLSILTSLIIFKLAKDYFGKTTAYISLFLMLFTVGNIQYSHFGTVEMWEAFFLSVLLYGSLKIAKRPSLRKSALIGVVSALAISTKLLTVVAVPAVIFSLFYNFYNSKNVVKSKKKKIIKMLVLLLTFSVFLALTLLILMPHVIFDFSHAYPSIKFESEVALGTLPVFYTQSFHGTIPYLFQLINVLPFLINPINTFLLLVGLSYMLYFGVKKKSYPYLLPVLFFFAIFFLQGHFFVKWTRYYVPAIPFAILTVAVITNAIYQYLIQRRLFPKVFLSLFLLVNFSYGFVFFIYTYVQTPTQVTAAQWALNNIPKNSSIVTEPFDPGIAPFHVISSRIQFFNFYEVDANHLLQEELPTVLEDAEYIILPSQRILRSRTLNPKNFPLSSDFYEDLTKSNGFKKVYETPCDAFCKILYLGDPIKNVEETANVFDRPTIMIFKKTN